MRRGQSRRGHIDADFTGHILIESGGQKCNFAFIQTATPVANSCVKYISLVCPHTLKYIETQLQIMMYAFELLCYCYLILILVGLL
jgi:hypothetical protein